MKNSLKNKSIWVTWEVQPRNRSMSHLLGINLYEIIVNKSRLIKYPFLIARTLTLLYKTRPHVLFVQNPSIVLAYISALFKNIFSYSLVVDAHNAGIYPLEGESVFLNFITQKICKQADMVIVTNQALAKQVIDWGGRSFVMPDPLPEYSVNKSTQAEQEFKKTFLLICTWADDEPYLEIMRAAESFSDEVILKITGNYKKKLSQDVVDKLSKNIVLLGFVSEEQYVYELSCADFTIDLTTRDNCLVCGAYESVAMGVPGIISDTNVNREVFSKGFIFTKNDVAAIVAAIKKALVESSFYLEGVIHMKSLHIEKINNLKEEINRRVFG